MDANTAIANAARILENAEMTTDLVLMERLTILAATWADIAALLTESEKI